MYHILIYDTKMTHVSRKKLPNKILRQILDSFLYVLTDIKDKEAMAEFLDSFLSPTEKLMLAKRLAIAFLLTERVERGRDLKRYQTNSG